MAVTDKSLLKRNYEEKIITPGGGFKYLFIVIFLFALGLALVIVGAIALESAGVDSEIPGTVINVALATTGGVLLGVGCLFIGVIAPVMCAGFKVISPNEALVLLIFGKYKGTIIQEGFFWVNPFCVGYNPGASDSSDNKKIVKNSVNLSRKKISLKAMTLNNEKQKVNDEDGNPIEIGVVVIWKIVNTAKAVFNVDNYSQYVSTQADSAIRNVARKYPYDVSTQGDEKSLRGSSQEIADTLRAELQERVEVAGVEILEARITHLAYAQEIAAAMLQRQQASAIIEARQKIVEGAVGMVEMALNKLSENKVCELDDERKAQMVSNLLVVLCGNRDAQPIVNSSSLY